jgi:hypothetical protein
MYKITNIGELKSITAQTGDALDMHIDPNDSADIVNKINLLSTLLGSSCEAVALAQRLYDRKMFNLMTEEKYAKFPPYEKKLVFDGLARDETYYVKLTENQNSALKNVIYTLDLMLQAQSKY